MDRGLVDQFWQNLEIPWSRMKTVVSEHVVLAVGFVAIILLFWFFLSPRIKNK
ncbi:MAG: hypothetical protein WAK96_00470 [Desulfobaccales bacterium]